MSNLGMGVMIQHLFGGGLPASDFYGRTICGAEVKDDELVLTLDGAERIAIHDAGQSCCESRYMTTDDDLSSLVGHKLTRIEAKPGPGEASAYGDHETCFVEVGTDKGFVTLTNHNEHNGYYGGFALSIRRLDQS